MIPGDSVQDANPACRSESDDASRSGTTAGYDTADHGSADHEMSKAARSPRTHRTLQDIQNIIDELAAVTQQLRSRGASVPGPLDTPLPLEHGLGTV